jgi:leader peptidase (prepilin peptidase)/N-methyltransferase
MMLQLIISTLAQLILPVAVVLKFKITIISVVLMPFAIASYPLIREDFRSKRLPNRIMYATISATFLVIIAYAIYRGSFTTFSQPVGRAIIAFVIGFVLYVIARGGFGAGDVKLFFLAGLTLGIFTPAHMIAAMVISFLGVALFALALLLTKQASKRSTIAFGPFIILGSWLVILLFN